MTIADVSRKIIAVPAPAGELVAVGRVVVGLRCCQNAANAIAVGFAEAHRRAAQLSVVVIRDDLGDQPTRGSWEPAFHAAHDEDVAAPHDLLAAVADARRAFPTVPVTTDLRWGHFSDILVDLSRSADLVVLGLEDRPLGLGRSDVVVASHADCPVIVVRDSASASGF